MKTKIERLQEQLAGNERMLKLYDSPFPDAWEKAKRAELIADINEVSRQILELENFAAQYQ